MRRLPVLEIKFAECIHLALGYLQHFRILRCGVFLMMGTEREFQRVSKL